MVQRLQQMHKTPALKGTGFSPYVVRREPFPHWSSLFEKPGHCK